MNRSIFYGRAAHGLPIDSPSTEFNLKRGGFLRDDGRLTMKGVRLARTLGIKNPKVSGSPVEGRTA